VLPRTMAQVSVTHESRKESSISTRTTYPIPQHIWVPTNFTTRALLIMVAVCRSSIGCGLTTRAQGVSRSGSQSPHPGTALSAL
jgi:hypothetical protein